MLIPREVLFGNPERLSPRISPDGAHLAYIAPDGAGVLQVWLRAESGTGDKMLTADKKRGIRAYFWTHDGEQLIYMQDADGDENFHFYGVNINTDVVRDLTPFQGVRAEFVALSYKHPHEVLVALNLIDRSRLDVYRVNLKNGAVELDTENPGAVAGWVNDEDLRVRAALAFNAAGGKDLLYRPVDSAPWQTLRSWSPDDEGGPEGFSADGRRLYIMSNQHSNAIRLSVLDLESMQETVIAQDPEFDVSEVLVHPTTRDIQAVGFYRDKLEWQALDPAVAADLEVLAAGRAGEVRVVGRDIGDKVWIVACTSDDGPVYYHRYDRAAKTDTFLFSHKPALEGLALAKMKPVAFISRDGLSLRGYLSLPPEPAAAMPLPTVLLVHGGPWGRDVWGFNSYAQWLANRGYAVLQVNFRGSTGYGRDFLNAGNREWGAKMHDDLIDAVNWIVAQGIADPAKVAIMGGSYGGYATLAGLTFTPDVFAAGVDICGPSSIMTLLRSIPPYWAPMLGMFRHRVGDPDSEREFLDTRSPLSFVDRIKAPLLIGQGANDPRVKQAESEQIVDAMRKRGLPVEYFLYTDEGHGFVRPENNLHFNAVAEQFLAKHLGGACEPLGEIAGHSGVIR